MTIEEQIAEAIRLTEECNLRIEKHEIVIKQLVDHITVLTEKFNNVTIIEKSNLSTKIKNINIQDPLLKDIFTKLENNLDLPKVDLYYTLQKNATLRSDVLLSLENGYPFLVKYHQTGAGNIFVFTSPPNSEYNRFVNSSLFAPIMFKIGNFSQNYYQNAYLINDNTNK
jgi:uncharacterized coiled-coil protein SlyX